MIIEWIVSTALQEYLRNLLPSRKTKNNKKRIEELKQGTNHVKTVGELREVLAFFSDDVPLSSSIEHSWMHVQVREVDGKGSIAIGQVTTWG